MKISIGCIVGGMVRIKVSGSLGLLEDERQVHSKPQPELEPVVSCLITVLYKYWITGGFGYAVATDVGTNALDWAKWISGENWR